MPFTYKIEVTSSDTNYMSESQFAIWKITDADGNSVVLKENFSNNVGITLCGQKFFVLAGCYCLMSVISIVAAAVHKYYTADDEWICDPFQEEPKYITI